MVSISTDESAGGIVTAEELWQWLGEVSDPEIPVISVTDLGIVRKAEWHPKRNEPGQQCVITITPTYSGCPAIEAIEQEIRTHLLARGITDINVVYQLSPAWSTDWMTEAGRQKLSAYGIAPPQEQRREPHREYIVDMSAIVRSNKIEIICPQCGSAKTRLVSQFGSTSCKALYKCSACLEPFDYFKPH